MTRDSTVREYELRLFWGFRMWLNSEPGGFEVLVQYINNILFFIPFGFLLCESGNMKWKQVLITGVIASLCVELTQYVTARGLAEADDVISNTTGAMVGFLLREARIKLMGRCVNVR